MAKQRVLITVKTYPTLSRKYGETVCTAGVREDGTWVRIYPVPFRRLNEEQQYKKYDWLEVQLVRNSTDPRPETYRPFDSADLEKPVGHMDTDDQWRERRKLLLKTARVYDQLDDLIAGAKANEISLAVFKPTRITDFVWEEEERAWDPENADSAHRDRLDRLIVIARIGDGDHRRRSEATKPWLRVRGGGRFRPPASFAMVPST